MFILSQTFKIKVYNVKGSIWIESKTGTFIGYGRAILLDRIKTYGSINEAAKSMKMSYKHAWKMLDSMNKQASSPILEKNTGGKGGGGTTLTPEGENLLDQFWNLYKQFEVFNKQATSKLNI